MNDSMRTCIFAVGLAATAGVGAAQADGQFELQSTNMLTRSDPFSADEELTALGAGVFDLETGWDSNTWVRRVQPRYDDDVGDWLAPSRGTSLA